MNIISNNCIGAYMYKYNDLPYKNPLMWTHIDSCELFKIMERWDTINWEDCVIETYIDDKGMEKIHFLIDKDINVYCGHYIKDDKYDTPKIVGNDVYYKNIVEYATDKYFSRLKRMRESGEPPIFVMDQKQNLQTRTREMRKFISFDTPYKKILCTYHTDFEGNDNCKIYVKPTDGCKVSHYTRECYNQCKDFIEK